MSKSSQQIEKDLADLENQFSQFAIIFYQKYQKYLDMLSQTVRQQLILASYQICTQIHPNSFLELSLSSRQNLQEQIRYYGNNISHKIKNLLNPQEQNQDLETENPIITTPADLLILSQNIKYQIQKILDNYSNLLNKCFRETAIFPSNLTEAFLEMAIEAQDEASSPITASSTNLLQVLVGNPDSDEEDLEVQETKINTVIIVHLKLTEIEFGNPSLGIEHQQLNSLNERLKSLFQVYQQKQRELAIVQAQSAWRSLWYDS